MDFNLEIASKSIPTFTGNYKDINCFLKVVEIINRTLKEEAKPQLIEYTFYCKLSSNVQTALANEIPTTLQELKTTLENKFKSNQTIPHLHSLLNQTTQKGTITGFKDKILNIIADLNNLQIKQLGPNPTNEQKSIITSINDTYALTIFKNGLDDYIKPTIFAAQPKTFSEAINIALQYESATQINSQVMRINYQKKNSHNRYTNNRNSYTNNNRNQYHNNNSNRNNQGYNNQNRNYNNNNNSNRTNNNNNPNTNYTNNNFNRNNNNNWNFNYRNQNNTRFQRNNNQNNRVHAIEDQGNGFHPDSLTMPLNSGQNT
ncbi:uncharacterized protein ACN427_013758 [Glossina fuscipes fuscipes]